MQRRALTKQIALSRHRLALLKELHRNRDRVLRSAIHEQLVQVSQTLGLSVPEPETIGLAYPETPDVLKAFWMALAYLDGAGARFNHAKPGSRKIYLNLPELRALFREHQIELRIDQNVIEAVKQSKSPRFLKAGLFSSFLHQEGQRVAVRG